MGALSATYAGWTGRPWGESTRPDLAVMGPTSLVVHSWKPQHYPSRIRGARRHSAARLHGAAGTMPGTNRLASLATGNSQLCPRWGCAGMISEDALRQMSVDERAALSRCLAALDAELPSLSAGDRRRRRLVLLLTGSSVGLIPWIVLLAITLPPRYVAGHWTLTWVGFDSVLLSLLALTAWLAWRRRQALIVTAFLTAALLVCDAWFDITTASGRADTIFAIASAVLLELPLAALLFAVARHLLHFMVCRAQAAAQGTPDGPSGLLKMPLLGVPREPAQRGPSR
jgi:hypothetical protein